MGTSTTTGRDEAIRHFISAFSVGEHLLVRDDDQFGQALAACAQCGEPRATLAEPRMVRSRAPLWLRSAFRRMQLERIASRIPSGAELSRKVTQLRRRDPGLAIDRLGVVCCYFNPCGYESRKRNYRRFARALAASEVPLLTVDLAIGDQQHELEPVYGEILQVRSQSVLWHKERLLNIGIERLLQQGFQQIAWLDADVEFEAGELWPWFVAKALRDAPLAQVFSRLVADTGKRRVPAISSVEYLELTGEVVDQANRPPSAKAPLGVALGMPGYGWAARAEVLKQCQLYDRAIVGGGDKLMFAAAVSGDERRSTLQKFLVSPFEGCQACGQTSAPSAAWLDDLDQWASRWYSLAEGRPSRAELSLEVLFHGSWTDRRYWHRQEILAKYEYDPETDLTLNDDGCWEWASDKPELHAAVADYFRSRQEDATS